ncbi:MAG: inorganic phosphate transporter [Leptolyngbyaceae cyanobacterium CSU_1_3]|nr:inorganic phosphate transporter [Leptolyngbyaceae cyanobacterium CSU_1_3]
MELIIVLTSVLALYLSWNLGANDVANSMGTSVGSKAVTLKQALVIAGVLEFTGAVLFGQEVSAKLATGIVNLELFAQVPQSLLLGMVSVLIATGIWLNLATVLGLPVSSSHATVGAIAGFACIALNLQAVNWSVIGVISITWIVTPVVSGAIAACFYGLIKHWILEQPNPIAQLQEWIPWLSVALISIVSVIVLPTLSEPIRGFLGDRVGLPIPAQDIPLMMGGVGAIWLTWVSWWAIAEQQGESIETLNQSVADPIFIPSASVAVVEGALARLQVVSACFVAFAHGSNDVGNAVAPLAAIVYISQTGTIPLQSFQVPLWILVLGGVGIVAGLAVWGKKVIATIGEGIISLQPSGGFCAELATATTVLVASQVGLPVSTSHALVGGVMGVGLVQGLKSIRLQTVRSIVLTWFVTIPIAASLSAGIFALLRAWGENFGVTANMMQLEILYQFCGSNALWGTMVDRLIKFS